MIHKKFKFDHATKWYTRNLESVLENERHKVLWDFEIQTGHLISARRPCDNRERERERERERDPAE